MDWLYPLSGLLVGLIVGLTGVGGGSLMTPLLVLGFGFSPATAVGTDLLYAAFTKGRRHLRTPPEIQYRLAHCRPARRGSVPASLITLVVMHSLGASK